MKSGFPLQMQIGAQLKENGYDVINSPLFFDSDEKKTRELDIECSLWSPKKETQEPEWYLNPFILIECKKSEKYNWVFYDSDPVNAELSVGNYMDYLLIKNGHSYSNSALEKIPFRETLIRHCITSENVSSAYQQIRTDGHEVGKNEILDAISKLIKYMNYHFSNLIPFFKEAYGLRTDILFYYPTVVFDGSLYFASFDGSLNLEPVKHIVYETRYLSVLTGDLVPLYIDVIKRDSFKDFLNVLKKEIAEFDNGLRKPAIQKELSRLSTQ